LGFLATTGGPAAAQAPPGPPAPAPTPPLRAQLDQRVGKLMLEDALREAGIPPASADRVRAVWARYQQHIAPLRRRNAEARQALRALLQQSPINPQQLQAWTDTLVGNQAAIEQLQRERQSELRQLLGPALFARWILAWPVASRRVASQIQQGAHPDDNP
jgi:Spy/CpxP family protein refolding chaperone